MPIIGKKLLCATALNNFNQFVGFDGGRLYQKFDTLKAVISYHGIPHPYCDCFAQAEEDNNGNVNWWTEPWNEVPTLFKDLPDEIKHSYEMVFENTRQIYVSAIKGCKVPLYAKILNDVIQTLSLENAYCFDKKIVFVAWGMVLDNMKAQTLGSIVVPYVENSHTQKIKVTFECQNGTLKDKTRAVLFVDKGTLLDKTDTPIIIPNPNHNIIEWMPFDPQEYCVTKNCTFVAICKEVEGEKEKDIIKPTEQGKTPTTEQNVKHKCTFESGKHGKIDGGNIQWVKDGCCLSEDQFPSIKANKGFEHVGWDKNTQEPIYSDIVYTAKFKKKPWWRRFGIWLSGLWRWMRLNWWKLLLALLLLLLLLFLLKCCRGYSRTSVPLGPEDSAEVVRDPNMGRGGIYNPGSPYRPNPTDGEYSDILPPQEGVLPPVGDEIIDNPDEPPIIANQINIVMENVDRHIGDLARKFKQLYPGANYEVIYYDNVTKRMNVTVPSIERTSIKQQLPQQVAPEFDIFVFDEALFEGRYIPNDPDFNSNNSWYLEKINLLKAWDITKGSQDISVAIVDNGFNLKHPELKSRICGPYNVWRHSDKVDAHKVDHGSHVAGIALASMDNGKGSCGIAPHCSFIPIQVADDRDRMTTTSILDGILYAIYQGADVVNVSLGQNQDGFDAFPEDVQRELIRSHFKEEERLWNKVMKIAEKHHCVIVFAAGNDNVLAGIDPLQRSQDCIVVSAVNRQGRSIAKADFSNYGEFSTVSAPGVDIYSCFRDGFASLSGTSMAAPVVTGIVALMKSIKRDLTVQEIRCILQTTGLQSTDRIGPMVQAYEAIEKVSRGEKCEMVEERADSVVIHHGDVEISLMWNNLNDLDLVCEDPSGEIISFQHKAAASGGSLDVDMNCSNPLHSDPIEHIYWPVGGAPQGKYRVSVIYYARHDENIVRTPFLITVKANGQQKQYQGELTIPDKKHIIPICTFEVN